MTSEQKRKIKREFYRYQKNRDKAASDIAEKALAHFGMDYSSDRVKSSPGNVSENQIVRFIDEIDESYRWCIVFEKTIERFRWTGKDKIMRMKFIDHMRAYQIQGEIGIERSTYFYWLNDILCAAYMWARDLKLF